LFSQVTHIKNRRIFLFIPISASKSLGLNPNVLSRWIKEHEQDGGHAFRSHGVLTPEQDEIRKLKSQVKSLEMEREILKNRQSYLPNK